MVILTFRLPSSVANRFLFLFCSSSQVWCLHAIIAICMLPYFLLTNRNLLFNGVDVILAIAMKCEKYCHCIGLGSTSYPPQTSSSIWHARWACRRLLSLCRRLPLSHIQIQISNLVGIYRLHKFSQLTVLT